MNESEYEIIPNPDNVLDDMIAALATCDSSPSDTVETVETLPPPPGTLSQDIISLLDNVPSITIIPTLLISSPVSTVSVASAASAASLTPVASSASAAPVETGDEAPTFVISTETDDARAVSLDDITGIKSTCDVNVDDEFTLKEFVRTRQFFKASNVLDVIIKKGEKTLHDLIAYLYPDDREYTDDIIALLVQKIKLDLSEHEQMQTKITYALILEYLRTKENNIVPTEGEETKVSGEETKVSEETTTTTSNDQTTTSNDQTTTSNDQTTTTTSNDHATTATKDKPIDPSVEIKEQITLQQRAAELIFGNDTTESPVVPTDPNTPSKFKGLFFDGNMVCGIVFMKCKKKQLTGACDGKDCADCKERGRYVEFSLLQPFDFQLIIPPIIFGEIYEKYGCRPVNSLDVLCVYLASIEYFDVLFDPERKFLHFTCDLSREHRTCASKLWEIDKQKFKQTLISYENKKNKATMLSLFTLFEFRIVTGIGICKALRGECKLSDFVNEFATRRVSSAILEWPRQRRCFEDHTEHLRDRVNKWNIAKKKQKKEFIKVQRQLDREEDEQQQQQQQRNTKNIRKRKNNTNVVSQNE